MTLFIVLFLLNEKTSRHGITPDKFCDHIELFQLRLVLLYIISMLHSIDATYTKTHTDVLHGSLPCDNFKMTLLYTNQAMVSQETHFSATQFA